MIAQTGHKTIRVIDELLLLCQVAQVDVELKPINMGAIVTEVMQNLADIIEESNAELIVPTSWPTVQGHEVWLEKVWQNYLSNGLKYGGQPPRLELGAATQEDGMVSFWVSDNGPGLTLEEQTQLFRPFTRLAPERANGHGLGLSTVQRIVEKLGGAVLKNIPVGLMFIDLVHTHLGTFGQYILYPRSHDLSKFHL